MGCCKLLQRARETYASPTFLFGAPSFSDTCSTCVATFCDVLQCVAVCCSVVAEFGSVLQCMRVSHGTDQVDETERERERERERK